MTFFSPIGKGCLVYLVCPRIGVGVVKALLEVGGAGWRERGAVTEGGKGRKLVCMYTTYLPQIHFYTVQFMSETALSLLFTLLLPVDIRLSAQTILRTALYLAIQVPPLPT